MKQWSPRCSEAIKEIYDNLPKKGNAFLQKRLDAFYEQIRYKRLEQRNNFLQNLMSKLKPQIPEENAESQINFKLSKKNAQKIEYFKEKLGLSDSELFELLVLMRTSSEISPIEPLEEKREKAPETETREPLEEKPSQTRQEKIIRDLLANRCHNQYFECVSEPFLDKDERFYINCPKPIFKKDRYGRWIPSGKFHGKIPIEQCSSMQRYRKKKTEITRGDRLKIDESAEEKKGLSRLPKKPSIEETLNQTGLCKNPLIMRGKHSFNCAICKKKDPDKREACDLIFEELETSPMARRNFIEAMTSRKQDLWQSPKTENMSFEEIERELGLRSNPPSYEDLKFDAFRKRYDELCGNCEAHLRCSRYCREFLNGLELPREVAS